MVFTVKYKRRDASIGDVVIEADGREAAFVEARRRGIAPINVLEAGAKGAAVPHEAGPARPGRPPRRRSLLKRGGAGMAVAVIAASAWLWLTRGDGGMEKDKVPAEKPKRIPTVKHVVAERETESPAEGIDPKSLPDPKYRQAVSPGLPRKKYIPTIAEVEKARLGPDGKPRKMSIYKSPLEQSLGMLFTTKLGSPPPMLPDIGAISTPERLQQFFGTIMEAEDGDSDEVKENRQMMQQVQSEMKNYLAQGGSPEKFVEFYQNELRIAHDEWKTAQKMLIDMSRGGDPPEVLREFRDRANELLQARGIKPLAVPPAVRKAMEEE